jgi:methionyl-tRNA formyltransferase
LSSAKNFNFAIFGRHATTVDFTNKLHEKGFPVPTVIASENDQYIRDQRLLDPFGLFGNLESLANKGRINLYKLDNINCDEALKILEDNKCNIALSISCRNIIKSPIINFFAGKIFNLHDSYLPNERGGALNSWRILNGLDSMGCTIHHLVEGIDTGDIVLRKETKITKPYPKPLDYLFAEVEIGKWLVDSFIELILNSDTIPSQAQENDKSLYFPRLFTEKNGIINWDWEIEYIEKFIRAFSSPYPGAYSYYRKKIIRFLDVAIDTSMDNIFHPYGNGKVVTLMSDGSIRVIAGGRALIVKAVAVDGEEETPAKVLGVKHSLISPHEELLKARAYVPNTKAMNISEKEKFKI